jgi:uncharacterized protein YndB with AHSA1/START domain
MLPPIQHSIYINRSPKTVYQTLATAEGWDAWFTQGTELDTHEIHLRWRAWGPHHANNADGGKILIRQPDREFTFQWKPGESVTVVQLLLDARGAGTVVKVIESGYRNNPADLAAYVNCATGWGEALTLLKVYLEHGITYGDVPLG